MKEKQLMYEAAIGPVVGVVGEMVKETWGGRGVGSAHEVGFVVGFRRKILEACLVLVDPCGVSSSSEGGEKGEGEGGEGEQEGAKQWERGWALFQAIEKELKNGSRPKLSLSHISPTLSSFRSSSLHVPTTPSLSSSLPPSSSSPKIEGVGGGVMVLPTKTKPKKMLFLGENGRKYPFLLKGREDLRLDERITQFFRLFSSMFSSSLVGKGREKEGGVGRGYGVFPMSGRCGLIEWVEEGEPLFTIYKKWQKGEKMSMQFDQQQEKEQQQQQQQEEKEQNTSETETNPPPPPPPSTTNPQPLGLLDSFKYKLMTVLRAQGLSHLKTRKDCPENVLLTVFRFIFLSFFFFYLLFS